MSQRKKAKGPSTVLIITDTLDAHADAVILELHKREIPVFRFHTEDYPANCSISVIQRDGELDGEIVNKYHRVRLKDICAAWYRRPGKPRVEGEGIEAGIVEYIETQATDTIKNLYDALDTLWVGHPHKLRRAELKMRQQLEAHKAGLKTLPTLISNDVEQASAFVKMLGNVECAIKPLSVVGGSDEQGYRFPLTKKLPRGHNMEGVALAPNIFQPYIHKVADLRCVVFEDKIFCAKILSQKNNETKSDWRAADCQHENFSLPEEIKTSIRRMMKSFDINFASLDLLLTEEGEYIFLDLNPNGQWLWLELELGLPLVASMADLLTKRYNR